jgi:ribonuclease HI|tara:strand:- start:109 stop:816 length:708 start_codon:yes stop_codon:yes gene_type:complete
MDELKAKAILDLEAGFSQIEMIRTYKTRIEEIHEQLKATTDESVVVELANELFNLSSAYIVLRDNTVLPDDAGQQPLVIFTDASVRINCEYAAFSIVAKNVVQDFSLPIEVLNKYNIQIEPESTNELCFFTGLAVNYDVNSAEMIAILAALEIFRYSAIETGQSMVFYTDSLTGKKVLGNKRLPPGTQQYSEIRKMFSKIVDENYIDVTIKKVKAHTGIEMNVMADIYAKRRLSS